MARNRGETLLDKLLDGRYRLERELGAGGSGQVFAATHIALEARVAVKVLDLPQDLRPEQHARRLDDFLEEARTLTRLKHPNIVTAIDLGVVEVGGLLLPYFVMELCQGLSLRDFLEQHGGVGVQVAWQLFEPLVRATAHAHRLGVVHRDIKPGNVMLDTHPEDGSWVPKLIDFGVAKAVQYDAEPGSGNTKTTSGASPYTPAYAAPEQVVGGRTGPWTDVHALGLLFVELVTGMPAYEGEDPRMRVIDASRPSAAAHGVDIGSFAPVIERAVSLKPQDRFRDAGELLSALLVCAAEAGFAVETAGRRKVHSAAFLETLDVQSGEARPPDLAETEQPISRDAVSLGQVTELATRAAPPPEGKTSRKKWWLVGVGAVAFALVIGAVALSTSPSEVTAEPPLADVDPAQAVSAALIPPATLAPSAAPARSATDPSASAGSPAATPASASATPSVRVVAKRSSVAASGASSSPKPIATPATSVKPPTLY